MDIKYLEIIKAPVITEKSGSLGEKNQYVFKVSSKANKIEIKMPQSMVSITGKNLEIRYYSEQEIVVCGKIESVKFI